MKKTLVTILMTGCLCLSYAQTKNTSTAEPKKDEKFAKTAAEAGMMEVMLGKLAETNAHSAEVKKFGHRMVEDHTKANNELKELAEKKGIILPKGLSEKNQKKYDEISKKTGKEFDKEYKGLMLKGHKEAVALFKKEADSGTDADLKSWAAKTLPTIEHHLHMCEETCTVAKKE